MRRAILAGLTAFIALAGNCRAEEPIVVLRDRYVSCVRSASLNDWAARGEKAMAVEQAFQACSTEEQAILTYISLAVRNSPDQAVAALIALKTRLKQDIISRMP